MCVSLRLVSQVLSEHAQYNEKADVYSFGIMIWYVSQHLYLARNTQLFRTATEHRSLMTPYRFGERVDAINKRVPPSPRSLLLGISVLAFEARCAVVSLRAPAHTCGAGLRWIVLHCAVLRFAVWYCVMLCCVGVGCWCGEQRRRPCS